MNKNQLSTKMVWFVVIMLVISYSVNQLQLYGFAVFGVVGIIIGNPITTSILFLFQGVIIVDICIIANKNNTIDELTKMKKQLSEIEKRINDYT